MQSSTQRMNEMAKSGEITITSPNIEVLEDMYGKKQTLLSGRWSIYALFYVPYDGRLSEHSVEFEDDTFEYVVFYLYEEWKRIFGGVAEQADAQR